jgi:hypothetical protein
MDRRTFLLRGSAALAATALAARLPPGRSAAVLPKQAAVVPATPKPPLWRRFRDAYGVEHLETVPESPTTTLSVDQYLDDAGWSSVEFDPNAPVMHILGGDVKIDTFTSGGYGTGTWVHQPSYRHWTLRASRLQGPPRRRLLRGR